MFNPLKMNRRSFLRSAGVAGMPLALAAGAPGDDSVPEGRMDFRRSIPIGNAYDVVVCGGGPSGFSAAIAARRAGVSVLVIEANGQLGGTGTSGLVSHWLGGRTADCQRWAVGGLFRSLCEEAVQAGVALLPGPPQGEYQPHGWHLGQLAAGIPFDPFGMAALLDARARAAGIDVLLCSTVVDVVVESGRITQVVLMNKSGLSAVPAKAVIDATGDADIAARAGCPCTKGREEDGLMTPASLIFHVDNVDQDALAEYIQNQHTPRFREKIAELRAAGEWRFPYDIFISVQLQEKGVMMINTTRLVDIDGANGPSVSEGLMRGRAEVQELMRVMRKHFPGFANVRLKAVAPALGVRETRRIRAAYALTVEDISSGHDFPDTIGFSAYGWDLPDPKKPSENPSHGNKREVTPIPYRVMTPQGVANLICPGRAISVERPVLGPLRVMAPCMAMGEAAGQAAAPVIRDNIPFTEVDTALLRRDLAAHTAVVEWT